MSLLPLGGVRVADHSVGIAGAYAAKLLSDSGATVVKIESPYRDPLRRRRALYEHLHEHHEQVVIDPTSALDRSRLDELLSSSGIVLGGSDSSGTRPRTDWNANLATLNPAAIAASISPFGASGPWCDGPANEFTLQAWSGKLATNYGGYADRPPVAAGGETGLWLTGAFVALGALAFFRLAARSGVGARVDVSILECMIAVFGQDAIARELADSRAGGTQRSGREIPSIHAASDGLVAFAIVTAQHWADFCVMIEQPAWGEDPELATSAGRRRRGEEVVAAVDAWVGERSTYEVTELAALLRIPAGVVADGATVPT
ncbi:MAG TPA: CoA transferase, partial [Acidimicrobiales bacterium]|nr:CoA transferase [Acidimicrobiales bacterium]